MEAIATTPLQVIRAQEEMLKAKDAQLQSLGFSLAQEKIENIQKGAMIQSLGEELAKVKIEVTLLKGVVSK